MENGANERVFVGAGFMPAFKFRRNFLFDLERGHKARAYKDTNAPQLPKGRVRVHE